MALHRDIERRAAHFGITRSLMARVLVGCVLLGGVLAGCGQTGALYLPQAADVTVSDTPPDTAPDTPPDSSSTTPTPVDPPQHHSASARR